MQIISEELQPLDDSERQIIKRICNKKILFWLAAYIALLSLLIEAYFRFIGDSDITDIPGNVDFDFEEAERRRRVGPIMISFFLVCLTTYFYFYYSRSIRPFVKDLKKGIKRVVRFIPETYKTPFFDNFYLVTGSGKRPLRISMEMYNAIQPGVIGNVSMLLNSRFILAMKVGSETMEFNEKNTILDL